MAMTLTSDFALAKEAEGYQPVFLVELPSLGYYYATREPGFSGSWLAGESLMAGAGVLAAGSHPTYGTILRQLRQGGIGAISYELDSSGFARTNNAAFSLLNGEYVSHTLQELPLNNAPVLIRLGFYGQDLSDYVPIFRGVIDDFRASFEALDVNCIDDTIVQFVPLPPQMGSDFFPRAFDQGKAIPILLGDVENVPTIQTIGAVEDILALEATPSSTYLITSSVNAAYPPTGSVTITSVAGASTVEYSSVVNFVQGNTVYTRLNLVTAPSFTHPTGSTVVLAGFRYTYLFAFAGRNIRRIRKPGITHPTASPMVRNQALEPLGADHRRVSVVSFSSEQEGITASIAGEARGANLFPNGLQHHNATDDLGDEGWTIGNGSWDRYLPPSTYDYVLRGQTLTDQAVPSDAYMDIPVTEGGRYRFTFIMKNIDAKFVQVAIGTPSSASEYYVFNELQNTAESLFDLSFVATSTTLRVTLEIENFTPPHAATTVYFDSFDLYDLNTENPATQIGHLIQTHMPGIVPHAASFAESEAIWRASGDRCAGIIQQTEETQSLLGRIAQQFRAKTFLNEAGEQKLVAFDQSRIPAYRFDYTHTLKGSVSTGRTKLNEIYTHYYVYFGRAPQDLTTNQADLGGRSSFAGVVFCTPFETNHSVENGLYTLCESAKRLYRTERTLEVFGDLIPDVATAENLLAFLVRKGTHQRYTVEFQTFLNGVDVEVTDFVTITHPLLPASHRGNRFEVVGKTTSPNGCNVQFLCEEINPFLFGGYTEQWEPPTRLLSLLVHADSWELPAPPSLNEEAFINPYTETWENLGTGQALNFRQWNDTEHTWNLAHCLQQRQMYYPLLASAVSGTSPYIWTTKDRDAGASRFTGPSVYEMEYSGAGDIQLVGQDSVQPRVYWSASSPDPGYENAVYTANDAGTGLGSFKLRPEVFERLMLNYAHVDNRSNFSLRALVKLDSKATLQPIVIASALDGSTLGAVALVYYDAGLDRFVFITGYNYGSTGSPGYLDTASDFYSAATSYSVVANSFGSPSTGTWYQICVTWNAVTGLATIQVDDSGRDSATITPQFTGSSASYVSEDAFVLGHVPTGYTPADGLGTLSGFYLNGYLSEFTVWTKVLEEAACDDLYNSGSFKAFPYS